jgi:hypothetical protein
MTNILSIITINSEKVKKICKNVSISIGKSLTILHILQEAQMRFRSTVFEKLLFPLHNKAYLQIQACFEDIEKKHSGTLAGILANYQNSSDLLCWQTLTCFLDTPLNECRQTAHRPLLFLP